MERCRTQCKGNCTARSGAGRPRPVSLPLCLSCHLPVKAPSGSLAAALPASPSLAQIRVYVPVRRNCFVCTHAFLSLEDYLVLGLFFGCIGASATVPCLLSPAKLQLAQPPAAAARTPPPSLPPLPPQQANCRRHNRRYCGSQRFRLPFTLPVARSLSVIVFGRLQAPGELGFSSRRPLSLSVAKPLSRGVFLFYTRRTPTANSYSFALQWTSAMSRTELHCQSRLRRLGLASSSPCYSH